MMMSGGILIAALVVLVLVGAGMLGSALWTSSRGNRVVPGVRTNAPRSWAGSHEPEALLHRRLRDAVRTVRKLPSLAGNPSLRAALEQEALAIDDRLIGVATLAPALRAQPLADVAAAVAELEAAVAALIVPDPNADPLREAVERRRLLIDAQAEVDRLALPDTPPAAPDVTSRPAAQPDAASRPGPPEEGTPQAGT